MAISETAQPAETSGCPAPLVWEEVVRNVIEGSREATVDLDDAQLTWMEFGTGKPLIVLPGAAATPRLFALTAWLLREQYRCYLMGHPVWKKAQPVSQLISKTAGLMEKLLPSLAGEGADMYASGYGGQVALELLSRQPATIDRAMLQGAWAFRPLALTEHQLLRLGSWFPVSLRRIPLWLSVQISNHRPWFPPYDESRFRFLLLEASRNTSREVSKRLLAAAGTDLRPQLNKIRTPLVMIRTEGEGQQITALQDELKNCLSPETHMTEEWLHTSGQVPYVTHPHRLVKLIVSSQS